MGACGGYNTLQKPLSQISFVGVRLMPLTVSKVVKLTQEYILSLRSSKSLLKASDTLRLYNDRGQVVAKDQPAEFFKVQDPIFGFVPILENNGSVNVYIRIGGGSEFGTMSSNRSDDLSEFGDVYDSKIARVQRLEKNVGLIQGSQALTYEFPDMAERHFLQSALNATSSRDSLLKTLSDTYPLRLVPIGKTLNLEVFDPKVKGYVNLLQPSGCFSFALNFLTKLIRFANSDAFETDRKEETDSVLEISEGDLKNVLRAFAKQLVLDFTGTTQIHLRMVNDRTFPFNDTRDFLFLSVFAQLLPKENQFIENILLVRDAVVNQLSDNIMSNDTGYFSTDTIRVIYPKIQQALRGSRVSEASVTSMQTLLDNTRAEATKEKKRLSDEKSLLELRIKDIDSQIATLEKRAKADATLSRNQKIVSVAAGMGSALYAVTKSDNATRLTNTEKAAVVAVGGALALIPYFRFISIAATPYAVSKGLDLRDKR